MSDIFKKVYRTLHADNANHIILMKKKAEELYSLFEKVNNREMSLAKTNLEQAMMWSTKAIVILDEQTYKDIDHATN